MVFKNYRVGEASRWKAAIVALLCCMFSGTPLLFARTHHYSSLSDRPEIFLKAIADYRSRPDSKCEMDGKVVRGGIVPHHFLANRMMVDFFECLASRGRPERIILIGPDHSRKGMQGISLSSLPWKTPFGKMRTDKKAVDEMRHALSLEEDAEAFSGEHSVGIIIPFINYYFPKSKIVPILVQRQASMPHLLKLRQCLNLYAGDSKTIILLSMDFSHYQTSEESLRRDALSKAAIQNLDISRIDNLDIDGHSALFILMSVLKESGIEEIYFRRHSNSSKITGIRDLKSVTSYYTVFFLGGLVLF